MCCTLQKAAESRQPLRVRRYDSFYTIRIPTQALSCLRYTTIVLRIWYPCIDCCPLIPWRDKRASTRTTRSRGPLSPAEALSRISHPTRAPIARRNHHPISSCRYRGLTMCVRSTPAQPNTRCCDSTHVVRSSTDFLPNMSRWNGCDILPLARPPTIGQTCPTMTLTTACNPT